ncbi:bone morphogenetic protein receptor type-2-like [Trichomycterus rosablanca]|uniref:bone morphogenetic protein receptor type-2-like n=1 Tax=Trichomycterus rosablanca TaxID=2290929 RepID=UPI002F352410
MQPSLIAAFLASVGWLSLPLSSGRKCAFLASPQNTEKVQKAGNVSGFSQHCVRTNCCMGYFRLKHGRPEPDLLGCSIMKTFCPEMSCHASVQFQNHIGCVCSSDFCNLNITWNHQTKQAQHIHTSDLLTLNIFIIPAAVVFIICSVISALKWKTLLKYCRSVTTSYTCDVPKETDIDLENVELLKVVASGHFACVWQGCFKELSVAVKVFPTTVKKEFTKEKDVYMLPLMKHPGIVQFLAAGRLGEEFVLVLELASQGSLNTFLSRTVCDWASTVKLAQTLSQGLAYLHTDLHNDRLHKPAVGHCDLSSSNVLVKADGSCALCDFGYSTVLQCFKKCQALQSNTSKVKGRIPMGTLQYMSPEILEGCVNLSSGQCLLQGDVYSLGLLLWEMFMRCSDLCKDTSVPEHTLPYEKELGRLPSLEALLAFVSENRGRPSVPQQWDKLCQGFSLHELLEDCWDHDPDARLTAQCAANRLA